jgi:hypothetical protein
MTRNPPPPSTLEGLDREIEILRRLIHKAAEKQSATLTLDEQLALLNSVGRNAPALARLLKARRELINKEFDPAALLRQALLELQEEWPELKKFYAQFDPPPTSGQPGKE